MNEIIDDVVIRDFAKSDLDDLLEVARLSFAQEFAVTGFDADRARKLADKVFGVRGRILLGFLRLFGNEPFKFLVAEVDNRVVGATMVTKQGKAGYIANVMVHPNHRREGIARKLMKTAITYIQSSGMKSAVLHVISSNHPAKNLYVGMGFREFEKIAYLVGKVDALVRPMSVEGIRIRAFKNSDLDPVYGLIKSSEDPQHLQIFGLSKNDLKTSFMTRITSVAKVIKLIALDDTRVVGYSHMSCTTANEAARIGHVHISPDVHMEGLPDMLIHEGINEIKKVGTKKIVGQASLKKPELVAAMNRLGFEKYLETEGMVLQFSPAENVFS